MRITFCSLVVNEVLISVNEKAPVSNNYTLLTSKPEVDDLI